MSEQPALHSRMYDGINSDGPAARQLRAVHGIPDDTALMLMVFRTSYGEKSVDCCWAGGKLEPPMMEPELTVVGLAAMEALMSLPGLVGPVIFAELKLGPTPLAEKVAKVIMDAPEGARIIFVGDLSKELSGHMAPTFNVTGELIYPGDAAPQ